MTPTPRGSKTREPITLDLARKLCPDARIAANVARHFGLDLPAYEHVRDEVRASINRAGEALRDSHHDKALAMHLQRVVGAYVQAAFGAGRFYGRKVTEARDATAKGANDARDEDRNGALGFDGRAERARRFAARVAMQAYAELAAAEGAHAAYAEVLGEPWRPYLPPVPAAETVDRRAAEAQVAAFG